MRVTAIQLQIVDRAKSETLARVLELVDGAADSDLILLPELWPSGYFSFHRYRSDAEPIDGSTVAALAERAAALRCHILMGSFIERDGPHLFNTSVLLDSEGRTAARYRKMHLFGHGSGESRLLQRGRDIVLVDLPWGRTGLSTCYDLRFPELYRRMTDDGAVFFLVASAWPMARVDAWRLFSIARAHENLAFLIACNCAGTDQGTPYAGHSLVVDPIGRVLAEAGEGEEVVSVEFDPGAVAEARAQFPALEDRVLRP
ncbi:MAG: carbon-nitrogen family hydrolase [Candidatus Brocadiaceae bacterium]|nr:carbon-nitrogen family hydrolase [Candidatus Brocadiaceae bacterium]